MPTDMRTLVQVLATQDVVMGCVFAGAGLVFVLLGVRIYKALVALSFGVFGFLMGSSFPLDAPLPFVAGVLGACAFGIIGGKFPRVGVAMLGGVWAAFIMAVLLRPFGVDQAIIWAVASLAFAGIIALTFVMFPEMTAFVTSLEGALLLIAAIIILFSSSPAYWAHIRGLLTESFFGPFLILAGTVTGYYLQMAEWRQKTSGGGI